MDFGNYTTPAKVVNSSLYTISDSSSGEIKFVFDSIDEVNFTSSSNVVSYPTEKGIQATDYKYQNPDVLEVKGVINKNSYIGRQNIQSNVGKAQSIEIVRQNLETYKSGIYKLDIQTKAALRKGYTLVTYEIPETIDNYSQFEVTMTFQQVVTFAEIDPAADSDSDTVDNGGSEVKAL